MYVCKYKYTGTYGGKSCQGHQVLAACEAGHKLCPAARTAVSVTSLKLQRAFHTMPCASPTLCRSTQPAQDSQVSSQDSSSTSLQHMHAVSKGQPSKNCSFRSYYPSPTPKLKQSCVCCLLSNASLSQATDATLPFGLLLSAQCQTVGTSSL